MFPSAGRGAYSTACDHDVKKCSSNCRPAYRLHVWLFLQSVFVQPSADEMSLVENVLHLSSRQG